MKKKNKISVIIPVYNGADYIGACLESIIAQKVDRIEIIVIDDGSTDKTADICSLYAKKDQRIKIFHTKNNGVSNARNLGISKASGGLIWFIDSDDVVKEGSLSKILEEFGDDDDMLVFGIEEFDKSNKLERKFDDEYTNNIDMLNRVLSDDDIRGYPFNKIFKTEIIKANKLQFEDDIKACEDLLFCVEYIQHSKKIKVIRDVLYSYRQRAGGALHSRLNQGQATALKAFEKIYGTCSDNSAKRKAGALLTKAYYKYRPILDIEQKSKYRELVKKIKPVSGSFSRKDKALIFGYRFCNPIMRFLHCRRDNNINLYDVEKKGTLRIIDKVIPVMIFMSFYIGMLNLGIISPIIVMGCLTFMQNLFRKITMRRQGITKVEILYFCFVIICSGLTVFSYDKIESLKQVIKICLLIFTFWQFIAYFRTINQKRLKESFILATFLFFGITFVMYIVGLCMLHFDFNIENVDVVGVTIDRHMPRLISLAYNDPNITALFLSVPFAFFLSERKSAIKHVGLIVSSVLIGLTVSRGAFISLLPVIVLYVLFNKEKIIKRIISVLEVVVSVGFVFLILIGITSSPSAPSVVVDTPKVPNTNQVVIANNEENNPITKHFDFQSGGGSGRLSLWNRAIEIIKKHPLTGIGLNTTYVYTEAEYHEGKYIHNTYLEILMEEGVFGGIMYVAVMVAVICMCWKMRKKTLFPALAFAFLFCAQTFLSVDYSEVFFADIMILIISYKSTKSEIAYNEEHV